GEKAGGVVASPVGERRSVRTVAQQLPNEGCGRRVKQKRQQPKTVPGREKDKSRVPVTALIAWPRFHAPRAEPQGAKQMAAPAEPRTPNMHRAKRIAPRECGWKHGDSGHSAGEKSCSMKPDKNRLDSDRPSRGRRLHSEPSFSAQTLPISLKKDVIGRHKTTRTRADSFSSNSLKAACLLGFCEKR